MELMRARNRQHGDYASGAGLKLARVLKRPPAQIAGELAERIDIPEATAEGAAGIAIQCSPSDSEDLPEAFIDYEEQPREHTLSTVTTTIEVQTGVLQPMRELSALLVGLGRTIEMLFGRNRKPIDRAYQDEEMFIG